MKAAEATPMANVMLSLLHKLGVQDLKSFGDSIGEFSFAAPKRGLNQPNKRGPMPSRSRLIMFAAALALMLAGTSIHASSPVADAAMKGDADTVRMRAPGRGRQCRAA